jgi:pyridoxamine 5'-phosphate oxidase
MSSWQDFLDKISEFENKFINNDIPRPEFWSGFRIVPKAIEFWQEGDFRIHQRFLYERSTNGWIVNQLYP